MAGEIDHMIATARQWRGAKMALATVMATWGSAPRPVGSHMLVHEDGRFEGSVSGGCVEGDVLHAAADTIADGKFRRLEFGVDDESAWSTGLPCGGDIVVMVQPVGPKGFDPALFEAIAEAQGDGRELAITTGLESGASRVGTAGEGWTNLYRPPRRLLIVGAVQIAQPLARIACELGIAITVIDPRGAFLTEERFPNVSRDDRWPDEAIGALEPDKATAVVTLSHDPKIDDPALVAALATPASYIAALGSTRSHAARCERLAAMGVGEEAIARIDAPAGMPIGSIGPAEIALSIAAGMVVAFSATSAT